MIIEEYPSFLNEGDPMVIRNEEEFPVAKEVKEDPSLLSEGDPMVLQNEEELPVAEEVKEDPSLLAGGDPMVLRDEEELPLAEEVKEVPDSEKETDDGTIYAMPAAERVAEAQNAKTEDGGKGNMKFELDLKALTGDPRDTAVGAAAVGVMADAVTHQGSPYRESKVMNFHPILKLSVAEAQNSLGVRNSILYIFRRVLYSQLNFYSSLS